MEEEASGAEMGKIYMSSDPKFLFLGIYSEGKKISNVPK